MIVTISILGSLLVASLCATGAFFLKWWETKKEVAEQKQVNARLEQKNLESQRKHQEEMTKAKKTISQLQANIVQRQRQRRVRHVEI